MDLLVSEARIRRGSSRWTSTVGDVEDDPKSPQCGPCPVSRKLGAGIILYYYIILDAQRPSTSWTVREGSEEARALVLGRLADGVGGVPRGAGGVGAWGSGEEEGRGGGRGVGAWGRGGVGAWGRGGVGAPILQIAFRPAPTGDAPPRRTWWRGTGAVAGDRRGGGGPVRWRGTGAVAGEV